MVSRGLLACTVNIEPGWPVFIACSASSASAPRTSPTMMRSGRIRSAFFRRSRMVISLTCSEVGARVSRRTTWGCTRLSSAASSSVTTRSSGPMLPDNAFRIVVLPGAGPAGHHDVELRLGRDFEQRRHGRMHRTVACEFLDRKAALAEPPDGDGGAVDGERRSDDVDAGAVRQTRVAHRAQFVHPAPHPLRDPLGDARQVIDVPEADVHPRQPAATLDVHGTQAVHQDVADLRVAQQRTDGAEAPHLVDQAHRQVAVGPGRWAAHRAPFPAGAGSSPPAPSTPRRRAPRPSASRATPARGRDTTARSPRTG